MVRVKLLRDAAHLGLFAGEVAGIDDGEAQRLIRMGRAEAITEGKSPAATQAAEDPEPAEVSPEPEATDEPEPDPELEEVAPRRGRR